MTSNSRVAAVAAPYPGAPSVRPIWTCPWELYSPTQQPPAPADNTRMGRWSNRNFYATLNAGLFYSLAARHFSNNSTWAGIKTELEGKFCSPKTSYIPRSKSAPTDAFWRVASSPASRNEFCRNTSTPGSLLPSEPLRSALVSRFRWVHRTKVKPSKFSDFSHWSDPWIKEPHQEVEHTFCPQSQALIFLCNQNVTF